MGNKLEQLLNSLIEKGWRPFNKDIREFFTLNEFTCGYRGEGTNHLGTIRAIVSKESGLWQFVCENKLTNQDKDNIKRWTHQSRRYVYGEDCWIENNNLYNDDYEYYIIESSLKDESELEDFLLSNIKVEGQ